MTKDERATATATAPCLLPSVANLREHWSKRARRAKAHRELGFALTLKAMARREGTLFDIKITRIAPRRLDGHDNLRASLKGIVDGIADALRVDDGSDRVAWSYAMDKCKKGQEAVRIDITFVPRRRSTRVLAASPAGTVAIFRPGWEMEPGLAQRVMWR